MTPSQLRRICNSLNDHRGTGGQTRLAELLDVHPTLIRKKLAGTVPISRKDALAIREVVAMNRIIKPKERITVKKEE